MGTKIPNKRPVGTSDSDASSSSKKPFLDCDRMRTGSERAEFNHQQREKFEEVLRALRKVDCGLDEKSRTTDDRLMILEDKLNDIMKSMEEKITKIQEILIQLPGQLGTMASDESDMPRKRYGFHYHVKASTQEKTAIIHGKNGVCNEKKWLLSTQTPWSLFRDILLSIAAQKTCYPETSGERLSELKRMYREASAIAFDNDNRQYSRLFKQGDLKSIIPTWRASIKSRIFQHLKYITAWDKSQDLGKLCDRILNDKANTFGYEGQIKRKFKTTYLARALQVAFRKNARSRLYTKRWGWNAYPQASIALVMSLLHFCLCDQGGHMTTDAKRAKQVYTDALKSLKIYEQNHPDLYKDATEFLWDFAELNHEEDDSDNSYDEAEGADEDGGTVDEDDDAEEDKEDENVESDRDGACMYLGTSASSSAAAANTPAKAAATTIADIEQESDDEDDIPLARRIRPRNSNGTNEIKDALPNFG